MRAWAKGVGLPGSRVQKGARMAALLVRLGAVWTVVSVVGSVAVGRALRALDRAPVR